MGRSESVVRVIGALMSGSITAASLVADALQFQPFEATILWQWWALGGFIIYTLICAQTWYRLARQVQQPLPAEVLKHHQLLVPVFERLRECNLLTHNASEIGQWILTSQRRTALPIPGATLTLVGQAFSIAILTERQPEWDYLRQHLSKDPIWTALDEWKEAEIADLTARAQLFEAVGRSVAGYVRLPVSTYMIGDEEEAIHPFLIESVYGDIFRDAVGMSVTAHQATMYTTEAGYRVRLPTGHLAVQTHDQHKQEMVITLSRFPLHTLGDMSEVGVVKAHYERAVAARDMLHDLAHRHQLSVALPRGSKCAGCPH